MKRNLTQAQAYDKGYLNTSKYSNKPILTSEAQMHIAKCGGTCETCPFEQLCEDIELWWGCYVWEEEMGEDL